MSHATAASRFVTSMDDTHSLHLLIDGMHCPSCVAIIEGALKKNPEITAARLNLSTRRLLLSWRGEKDLATYWVDSIESMGYKAAPFDETSAQTQEQAEQSFLLRCLAVAGFASGNLMLFSVPLWSSDTAEMGHATRSFFHWVQAAIAIPAISYCGLPFYRSAWKALKQRHTNMDVPISVAVILATGMSLFETATFGQHSYFDSGVMLLFFLLIGRYLEARARGRARSAAQSLLQMMTGSATVLHSDGSQSVIALSDIKEGMVLRVAAGEKIGADGEVMQGTSELDTSLVTGETLPAAVAPGSKVFAGTLNLAAPLTLRVTRAHEQSLIAGIVRLMELSEQSQARYVTLADRISSWYTPAVHALAAASFMGWWLVGGAPWQVALLIAATVLIITCPCALGLAVPVVQVLASGRLMRSGILLKSASALERLATISCAVFDKTGTLTVGRPELLAVTPAEASVAITKGHAVGALELAASLAAHSKHPLSLSLQRAWKGTLLPVQVIEVPGCGLEATLGGQRVRLGKFSWAATDGISHHTTQTEPVLELWLQAGSQPPVRFHFSDQPRQDSAKVIQRLKAAGIKTLLLSGDRESITCTIASQLALDGFEGGCAPLRKTERLAQLKAAGERVLMVGDGLNDAPSLSAAHVSMSPASAMDITQNAADIVFQGEQLRPVITAWHTAMMAQTLVRQNFLLAILYNAVAIPLAVAGYVTPLIAAIAMSSSSLLVIANAMRLNLMKESL